tara:strand:- start:482 stop:607 length:126 start_codon:yes stop_codon:yes gene_type:complete
MSEIAKGGAKATPNQPPVEPAEDEERKPSPYTFESEVLVDK